MDAPIRRRRPFTYLRNVMFQLLRSSLLLSSYYQELSLLEFLQFEEDNPRKKRKIAPRRWYIRPWVMTRPDQGQYEQLMPLLRTGDPETYRKYLRVEPEMFHELLERIKPHITKIDTNYKLAIEPGLKLACTLRFLATGNDYIALSFNFLVAPNTISKFVPVVCEAIIHEFMRETIVIPTTPEGWLEIAQDFLAKWNFHHTIGAIDGKHIAIVNSPRGGSLYYNYKGYHSVVLLALSDAHGRFLYVDVGARGSGSDGGVFNVTPLRDALERDVAGVPDPEPLPGETVPVPYFIVGDNAFPMRKFLQKPYGVRNPTRRERNFNYRLSRARRVVENAFGMLAARFRLFLTTINVLPQTVEKLVLTACILHNMLRNRCPNMYPLPDIDHALPTTWHLNPLHGREHPQGRGPNEAKRVREHLADFYMRDTTFRRPPRPAPDDEA